jgi:cell division topological specificity factor
MSWLSSLFARNKKSAKLAKQRLQIVLAAERSARNSRLPDYLPALQRELQLVVAKYAQTPPSEVRVRIGHPRQTPEGLEVRIQLPQAAHA